MIKCFLCTASCFRLPGRPQLIPSAHRLEELVLRLGLDRPGAAPAAAAGKLKKFSSRKNPLFKAVFFDKEMAFPL
ncbi:MAG: hypothetical protein EA344_09570 [Alkalicoccus sp.]|nr:MAG: hypothetical protein EA344_09570 [Alkalicoccus sp.]